MKKLLMMLLLVMPAGCSTPASSSALPAPEQSVVPASGTNAVTPGATVWQDADYMVPATPIVLTKPFRAFIHKVMTTCAAPLSDVRRNTLAAEIDAIVPNILPNKEDQEMFVLLICIESKFVATARSAVGAVGLAQVMPKYSQDFANLCALGKLGPGDIEDAATNITLGACFFKHLLFVLKSPILAVAAYNSGASSGSVVGLRKLGSAVPETANYVAKMAYLKEVVNERSDR